MKNNTIHIKYLDSAIYDGEFDHGHNFKPVVFDAVGWLVKEDKESITLAREINTTNDNAYRAVLVIPKVAILSRTNK